MATVGGATAAGDDDGDGTIEFFERLLAAMEIKPAATVRQYAEALHEAGASLEDFEATSAAELASEYGFKKLHVKRVETHRAAKVAALAAWRSEGELEGMRLTALIKRAREGRRRAGSQGGGGAG